MPKWASRLIAVATALIATFGMVGQSSAQSAGGGGTTASADEWPSRQVTLVVPYAAGGPIDTIARIIAPRLSELLGQQIVIDNQGGAGGMTGAARVAKAAPDGYTILLGGSAVNVFNQAIYRKSLYDSLADFTYVTLFAETPRILITRKDLPVNTLAEFNAYAKANADKMQYGSSGVGGGTHVCALLLDAFNGTRIAHVPYRGSALVAQDLIAGRLDFTPEQASTSVAQIESGSVKGIAVMGKDRVALLPNLPTAAEQGAPSLDCGSWSAFVFPKGVSDAVVQKLAKLTDEAVETPAVRERYAQVGITIPTKERRTPEYVARYTAEEIPRWTKVLRDAGINPQ